MKRLLRVRTGRHPHEIMLCAWAGAMGLLGLILGLFFGESISGSVERLLAPPVEYTIYGGLVLGSAVTLTGIFYRKKIEGMLIERVGLGLLACLLIAYVICVVAVAGTGGLMAALFPAAYAVANALRIWQIGRDLHLIKDFLSDQPEGADRWNG